MRVEPSESKCGEQRQNAARSAYPFDLPKQIVTGPGTSRTTLFDYTADGTRVLRRDATTTQHFASSLYHRVLSVSEAPTPFFRA